MLSTRLPLTQSYSLCHLLVNRKLNVYIVKPDRKISVPLPSCENRTLCTPGEAICAHSCACTIQLWSFREEQSGLSRETNFVSKMYWYSKIYIRSLSNMQFDFRRRLTQNETSRKIETIAVWKLIFGAIHNEWFCRCNTTSLHGFLHTGW